MLNSEEMYAISVEISGKYAPLFSARPYFSSKSIALSSQELLDISNEITLKFKPKLNSLLPKLVLLPIDPAHLHVAWNLGITSLPTSMDKEQTKDIVVRVYTQPNESSDLNQGNNWFDVNIDTLQSPQKVTIPAMYRNNNYTAVLGKFDQDKHLSIYAQSNVVNIYSRHSDIDGNTAPDSLYNAFSANQEKLTDIRNNTL